MIVIKRAIAWTILGVGFAAATAGHEAVAPTRAYGTVDDSALVVIEGTVVGQHSITTTAVDGDLPLATWTQHFLVLRVERQIGTSAVVTVECFGVVCDGLRVGDRVSVVADLATSIGLRWFTAGPRPTVIEVTKEP